MFEIFTEGMIFFEEKIFEHRQLDKITMIDKTEMSMTCTDLSSIH